MRHRLKGLIDETHLVNPPCCSVLGNHSEAITLKLMKSPGS